MKWILMALLTVCAAGNAMAQVQLNPGNDIQAAINANPPGTLFYLSAGIYRGQNLSPQNGDKFYGVAGQTILNGSVVLGSWTQVGGYWVTRTGMPTPPPYTAVPTLPCCPLAQHRNDLFINDRLYTRAPSLAAVTSGTWYFDEANLAAYLTDNPTGSTVELSVTPRAFTGHAEPAWGGANVTLQNLIVEKYASDSDDAAIAGGYGWVLNNVTARWNHGGGASIGANTDIEQGSYSDNGQEGIFLYDASNSVVHWAEIAGNNYAGYDYTYAAGGLKAGTTSGNPSSSGMQIIADYVHDNNGRGIHIDTDNSNVAISHNYIVNNVAEGIQDECNTGTIINYNQLSFNGQAGNYYATFGQITVLDSQNGQIDSNTLQVGRNDGNGITMMGIDRGSGIIGHWQLSHETVYNNTITYDDNHGTSGMVFWSVPNDGTNTWDYDTYYMSDTSQPHWFLTGNGDLNTWSQVQTLTPYERHGQALMTP
ncbi:MAG: right-handed parallel beta-helix repeat-containing protein [Steroidobacteraceae bacterium]